MANLIPLNLTLFLTVHFHAVHGYAATHMHITHILCFSSILPPPCSCIMPLISTMLALDSISRFDTNMYTLYDSTYICKSQGIDWHPQSDSLGVSPLKQTQSTHPLVSGLCCLLESLRQLICFIGCFTNATCWDSSQRKGFSFFIRS